MAAPDPIELGRQIRVLGCVGLEALRPLRLRRLPALADPGEQLADLVGDREGLLVGPAEVLLGQLDLLLAQGRAVSGAGVLLVRAAVADVGGQGDEGGPVCDALCLADRELDLLQRGLLRTLVDVPAVGVESLGDLLVEGEVRCALDRDLVVVIDRDQLAEPEVARKRSRLGGDALLHVPVAADHVGVMVDHLVVAAVVVGGVAGLGEREADAVGEALPERPGRDLDPRRDPVLRVARALAGPLAERLQVVEGEGRTRTGAAASTAACRRGRG